MGLKLGIIMDPIESIQYHKDTSLALLLAAQKRGWQLFYMQQHDLLQDNSAIKAIVRPLKVIDDPLGWFEKGDPLLITLNSLDVIFMRQDPPVDNTYLYTTFFLEQLEKSGTLVVNNPASVRDCNEKLFATHFPQCVTDYIVSYNKNQIKTFIKKHQDVICKPLNGLGGRSIFKVRHNDPNTNVILEIMTKYGREPIMVQKFIPEIRDGDKRVLIIDGKPLNFALARIPATGETRGNLAAGGSGVAQPLSDHDRWIAENIAPTLVEKGLFFVGIDIIGSYLTEINVTSPMGIRELNAQCNIDVGDQVIHALENKLNKES